MPKRYGDDGRILKRRSTFAVPANSPQNIGHVQREFQMSDMAQFNRLVGWHKLLCGLSYANSHALLQSWGIVSLDLRDDIDG